MNDRGARRTRYRAGRLCAANLGVKGPQVQILSSRLGNMQVRGGFGEKGVSILVPLTAICRAPAQDGGLGQRESYHSLRTVSPKGT